jgi:hypothetical protein
MEARARELLEQHPGEDIARLRVDVRDLRQEQP